MISFYPKKCQLLHNLFNEILSIWFLWILHLVAFQIFSFHPWMEPMYKSGEKMYV